MTAKIALSVLLLASPAFSNTSFSGYVKTWATLGEDGYHAVRQDGLLLKSSRMKMTDAPVEGVKLVLVPELAGGIQLLDAYATWEALPGWLDVQAGQFKIPFGQDRMETPASQERVDYSPVDKAILPRNAWDDGFLVGLKTGDFHAKLAAFEGLGPNLAMPNGNSAGLRDTQEYSGTLEWAPADGIAAGASYYDGVNGLTPTSNTDYVTGLHARVALGPAELRVEWINLHQGRYGMTVQPGYKLSESLKMIAYYDRVDDPMGQALARTDVGGGLIYQLNSAIRLNLEASGASVGPSECPSGFSSVFQALAKF